MPRMDVSLHQPLPDRFTWANSAHTDLKSAHIIVIDREVWVALAMPRKSGGWEACTGAYREYVMVSRWTAFEREDEAVRWIAGWVTKYASRIAAEVPQRRHRPVLPRRTREQIRWGDRG